MKAVVRSVLLLVAGGCMNAPAAVSISNFSVAQREGTKLVDIRFDADNPAGDYVSVSAAVFDGGVSIGASSFSGDVGRRVPEGLHQHVVWNGGADYDGQFTSNLSVTVWVSEEVPGGMAYVPAGTNAAVDPDFGSYSLSVDALYMDATEITKAEWDAVADTSVLLGAADGAGKAGDHPVQQITWNEALLWCNIRSQAEGLTPCYIGTFCDFDADGYRLPTSAEWEYAARGGRTGRRYPWGDSISFSHANYLDYPHHNTNVVSGLPPYTCPVGSFAANGYGLYDMAGNVWEWCWDVLESGRIMRGGSWGHVEQFARCGYLAWGRVGVSNNELGFRTVRAAAERRAESATAVFDSRDYLLMVESEFGSPYPAAGTNRFAWRSVVHCSVDAVVDAGGTNYCCRGWSGTGDVPALGSGAEVGVVLAQRTNSVVWIWALEDSDWDGLIDDWEQAYFGDLTQAATTDFDSDGQDNLAEYIAGTIPTNAASLFKLKGRAIPGGFVLEWPAAENRTYTIYSTPVLGLFPFEPAETNMTYPRNSMTSTIPFSCFKADVRLQRRALKKSLPPAP